MASLVGRTGRVTAAIRPSEAGEVMLSLRGGSQAYPARLAVGEQEEVPVGALVFVMDQIGRTVYVTATD